MYRLIGALLLISAVSVSADLSIHLANFTQNGPVLYNYTEHYLGHCQTFDFTCMAAVSYYAMYAGKTVGAITQYVSLDLPSDKVPHNHHYDTAYEATVIAYSLDESKTKWHFPGLFDACHSIWNCIEVSLKLRSEFVKLKPMYPRLRLGYFAVKSKN